MVNRFILNETSYHGKGAINELISEVKSRGFQKALIVTDKELVRVGIIKKITDLLEKKTTYPMPYLMLSRQIRQLRSFKPL